MRRPPGPTVLVGAAHCTYLCKKSETTVVNACCCADGPESCADDTNKCGTDPKVYEMKGSDAEIVCGECGAEGGGECDVEVSWWYD